MTWCIFGPNNKTLPLVSTNDICVLTSNGTRVTSGILYWNNNEAGVKRIVFSIMPRQENVWEVEKDFVVSICNIIGTSSALGNGDVSPTAPSVTVVVKT